MLPACDRLQGHRRRATWGDSTGLGCEHCEHEAACVRCPLPLLLRCSWWPSSLNSEKGNLKALFLISPSSVVFLSSLKLEEKKIP